MTIAKSCKIRLSPLCGLPNKWAAGQLPSLSALVATLAHQLAQRVPVVELRRRPAKADLRLSSIVVSGCFHSLLPLPRLKNCNNGHLLREQLQGLGVQVPSLTKNGWTRSHVVGGNLGLPRLVLVQFYSWLDRIRRVFASRHKETNISKARGYKGLLFVIAWNTNSWVPLIKTWKAEPPSTDGKECPARPVKNHQIQKGIWLGQRRTTSSQ